MCWVKNISKLCCCIANYLTFLNEQNNEFIQNSIILELSFNHFQIKKINVYLHVYQKKFEWWYVVQLQETLFNGVSFNFLGLPIWALCTVRLIEIRNHKISFLTNYFYYLLFEWVCVVFLALLHIRFFFIVYY